MKRPVSLIQHEHHLEIIWDDLAGYISHARLRAACPCAECWHGVPADLAGVRLYGLHAAGLHGICCIFSDGHQLGIYTWQQLRDLAQRYAV